MNGIIGIYKIGEKRDFQKLGNFNNHTWGLVGTITVNGLPFFISDNIITGYSISEFKVRKVVVLGDTVTVLSTENLTTSWIEIDSGVTYATYSYNAGHDLGITTKGLYEYYIKNSNGDEWVSDIWAFNNETAVTDGDYSSDYGSDYYISGGSGVCEGVCRIYAQFLPNIYPNRDYIDSIYTTARIIQIDSDDTTIYTEDNFATVDEPDFFKQRLVQAINYNAYKITLYGNESMRLDLLAKAEYVYIQTDQNRTYRASILDPIKGTNVSNTELRAYEIKFADINPANYKNNQQPVSNFLNKENIRDSENGFIADTQLLKFSIRTNRVIDSFFTSQSNRYTFYSKLLPKEIEETINITEVVDAVTYRIQSITKTKYQGRFYLTQDQVKIFQKYVDKCEEHTLSYGSTSISNQYSTSELSYEISDNSLIELYQVDIKILDSILTANSYNLLTITSLTLSNNDNIDSDWVLLSKTFTITSQIPAQILSKFISREENELGDNGLEIARTTSAKYLRMIFYMTRANYATLMKYHEMCSIQATYDSVDYDAVQYLSISMDEIENAVDLIKVTIEMIYEILPYDLY